MASNQNEIQIPETGISNQNIKFVFLFLSAAVSLSVCQPDSIFRPPPNPYNQFGGYGYGAPYRSAADTEKDELPRILYKVGAGYGVPYGIGGAAGEACLQHVSLFASAGMPVYLLDVSWSAGIRLYVNKSYNRVRTHASLIYGTTGWYDVVISGEKEYKGVVNGWGAFFGWDHDLGSIGGFILTYGAGMVAPDALPGNVASAIAKTKNEVPEYSSPFQVYAGINYQFGNRMPIRREWRKDWSE